MSYFRPIAVVLIDFIGRLHASATAFLIKIVFSWLEWNLGLKQAKEELKFQGQVRQSCKSAAITF